MKVLSPYDTAASLRDNAVSGGIYFGYSLHHNQFNSVKILLAADSFLRPVSHHCANSTLATKRLHGALPMALIRSEYYV